VKRKPLAPPAAVLAEVAAMQAENRGRAGPSPRDTVGEKDRKVLFMIPHGDDLWTLHATKGWRKTRA